MTSPRSDFATAGWAYGPAEAATAVSILQAAGIRVLPHGLQHASVAWHHVTALGGVELRVPVAQAQIAREILNAAPFTRSGGNVWLRLVSGAVMFLCFGLLLPLPSGGLYTVRPAVALAQRLER